MAEFVGIVASAVAFGQASAALGKGIRLLRSARDASAELSSLLNHLATLHALSDHMASFLETMNKETPDQQLRHTDQLLRAQLRLQTIIRTLDQLARESTRGSAREYSYNADKATETRASSRKWIMLQHKINQLRDEARETSDNLLLWLSISNSTQV